MNDFNTEKFNILSPIYNHSPYHISYLIQYPSCQTITITSSHPPLHSIPSPIIHSTPPYFFSSPLLPISSPLPFPSPPHPTLPHPTLPHPIPPYPIPSHHTPSDHITSLSNTQISIPYSAIPQCIPTDLCHI